MAIHSTVQKKQHSSSNLNQGHRSRLRDRFQKEGLTHFEDHEVLELMLFYAIPRADTNPIAHRLMQHFGSLSAVLEADMKDLQAIAGMGEQSALFIHALPALTRRYFHDRIHRDKPLLDSASAVSEYVKPLMAGRKSEVFYVLCLDAQCHAVYPAQVSQGTVKASYVHPRLVVEAALKHNAANVVLAHNHPSGSVTPSQADYHLTRQLVQALGALEIKVLDHIIVGDDATYSFADKGELPVYVSV